MRASRRDPRLPAIGRWIHKRDRHGNVLCSCRHERGGFRYAGVLYPSLSSAAAPAALELGLTEVQNGFVFWGLIQKGDALAALESAWQSYLRRARTAGDNPEHLDVLRGHLAALREIAA